MRDGMKIEDRGRIARTYWLGGKWFEHVGGGYLTQQGTWNCFNCGREAPYSFWRVLTGADNATTETLRAA